jgi:acetyl esterase/lipase
MKRNVRWGVATVLALMVWGDVSAVQALEADLPYGPDPKQHLDLLVPAAKGYPTVVFVHGGSLTTGDKADDDYRDVCAAFLRAAVACANVNYRLAPAHPWPAQAQDVAAAVAWVRAHIGSRGGDPRKLFLMGHSSGAMMAALVGTDERYLAQHGMKTSELRGVVPMGSIMWDDELEQAMTHYGRGRVEEGFRRDPENGMFASLDAYLDHWPIRHVRAGLPPFLFLIAESEVEQPPVLKTNRKFVDSARSHGSWAEYKVLSGRTHYSAIRKVSEPKDPVFTIIMEFIRQFSGAGTK